MLAHQFAEATASYKTWTTAPGVASSKRFAVVMCIFRRVEAAWQNETEPAVKGKQAENHAMEKVVFIYEGIGVVYVPRSPSRRSNCGLGSGTHQARSDSRTTMASVMRDVEQLQMG